MKKYFNTAGPCNPKSHYMIPAETRNKEIAGLIEQGHYFVIHSARQSGKTTIIQQFVNDLNAKDDFYALYCSLEAVQFFKDPKEGIPEILNVLRSAVRFSKLPNKERFAKDVDVANISTLLGDALKLYCSELDRPFVVFFDEVDGLQDGTLLTFLRQLRDGFITRHQIPFMHSVALVGLRNIRDYKSQIREGQFTLGSASPFNVITKALTLNNFTRDEVKSLLSQHTDATAQLFADEVCSKIFEYSSGQPWLVNALGREIINDILQNDTSKEITVAFVDQAVKNIILRRDTHIDSLLDKLKDPRVRKIIEPLILGKEDEIDITDDDTQYCLDLGLLKIDQKILKPANLIYGEVIIRTLNYRTQFSLESKIQNVWIDAQGRINMDGLLQGFQQFWRENSAVWAGKYEYKEAAPHLILQAFLQRVINGGGSILREYAAGRERMDLCVVYQNYKYPIELKIKYTNSVVEKGLLQLARYMDTVNEQTGWLVIFDRDETKSWDEKIFWTSESIDGKVIHVVGC